MATVARGDVISEAVFPWWIFPRLVVEVTFDDTPQEIDGEIRSLIDTSYATAETLLKDNEDTLHRMAETLLKYETIDSHQIDAIMEGREPGPPKDWSDSDATPPSKASGDDAGSTAKEDESSKPIGGPAGQH